MTDKEQIIIDGVDVKDCRRRIGKNSYCRYFKRLCSDNNVNCVWKQLARKTQECEAADYDYQKQLENTNKWIAECENLQQQLDQLRGENEELKKRLIQKDEVNMEHKPIYLDGVDVSGCSYGEIEKDILKCSCEYNVRSASMFCKDNPKCYYKQLKRKEKEYEELRQYHNKCCEEFENEKQKLIDKYNQFSKDFFIGKYCKKEYCELLKAKEQECEELENTLAFSRKCVRYNADVITSQQKDVDRYRKALEEIENFMNYEFSGQNEWVKTSILDIINKAKGEKG